MKELISIHVGEAGIRVGDQLWQLYTEEHAIKADRHSRNDTDAWNTTLFRESPHGRYTPRAIFVDLDTSAIQEIRNGSYHELFDRDQLICGTDAKLGVGPRYYSGKHEQIFEAFEQQLWRTVEQCHNLDGFIITHSSAGGTGSGVGCRIVNHLCKQYEKKNQIIFSVCPKPAQPLEINTYNNLLFKNCIMSHSNTLNVLFHNESLNSIWRRLTGQEENDFVGINRLICQVISAVTAPLRSAPEMQTSFHDLATHLIPQQKLNFLVSSHAPLISSLACRELTLDDITDSLFDPSSVMASCDTVNGRYISSYILYRGNIFPTEAHASVARLKNKPTVKFLDWCPTALTSRVNYRAAKMILPGSGTAELTRAASLLANTSSLSHLFSSVKNDFDVAYSKKAFLQHYEEENLKKAREDIENVLEAYEEMVARRDEQLAEEAARSYDAADLQFRGPKAKTNFLYPGHGSGGPSSSISDSFSAPPCPPPLDLELGHASSRVFSQRGFVMGRGQEAVAGMRGCGRAPAPATRILVVVDLNLPAEIA